VILHHPEIFRERWHGPNHPIFLLVNHPMMASWYEIQPLILDHPLGFTIPLIMWDIPSGYDITFTVRHGFSMALIEIDGNYLGLPNLKMHGGSFHGELLVITRWYLQTKISPGSSPLPSNKINGNFRILKWRYCTIFQAT